MPRRNRSHAMTDRASAEREGITATRLKQIRALAKNWADIASDEEAAPTGSMLKVINELLAALASVPAAPKGLREIREHLAEHLDTIDADDDGVLGEMDDLISIPAAQMPAEQDQTVITLTKLMEDNRQLRTQLETGRLSFGEVIRENDRLRDTIDVLESNARVQATLLADTGRERDQLHVAVEEMRSALASYRDAQRWATGTEEHRLAIQAADQLNPLPQWYELSSLPSTERS